MYKFKYGKCNIAILMAMQLTVLLCKKNHKKFLLIFFLFQVSSDMLHTFHTRKCKNIQCCWLTINIEFRVLNGKGKKKKKRSLQSINFFQRLAFDGL